mmetsp:Transcript_96878/g.224571  ORF Transcript_96878/g.224571 Transcript_96878/m.224571 type:complete len:226 (+) Transcript_96878:804-1481(+)
MRQQPAMLFKCGQFHNAEGKVDHQHAVHCVAQAYNSLCLRDSQGGTVPPHGLDDVVGAKDDGEAPEAAACDCNGDNHGLPIVLFRLAAVPIVHRSLPWASTTGFPSGDGQGDMGLRVHLGQHTGLTDDREHLHDSWVMTEVLVVPIETHIAIEGLPRQVTHRGSETLVPIVLELIGATSSADVGTTPVGCGHAPCDLGQSCFEERACSNASTQQIVWPRTRPVKV